MNELRGTGLRPQRMPGEWSKATLELGKESPQGAAKTGHVTSRSMAPLPSEVIDCMADGGGFTSQILASRPGMQVERSKSGGGGNAADTASDVGPMVTKGSIQGTMASNPHEGSGPGGF